MELLSRIWDALNMFFGGFTRGMERAITSLFGSSNARYIKKLQPRLDAINALEPKFEKFSDAELKEQTDKFRQRLAAGETMDDILVEAFALVREAGRRFLNMRHYDVQMIGGMVLHSGTIAEMVTGEGKTLVATLPAYLNALEGKGVHVVTVNDYLARRDMEWMGPLYIGLGLTVGAIQNDMGSAARQKAYACDITYGTNNEFGFDYLRDNMRPAARGDDRFPKNRQQAQGPLHYAIIDEVDNILIDEARTPLIISGPAFDDVRKYSEADRIARQLRGKDKLTYKDKETGKQKTITCVIREEANGLLRVEEKATEKDKMIRESDVIDIQPRHYTLNLKDHSVNLTDKGVREAEKLAGVESFYTASHMEWPHLIDNALKAHYLYKRDVNYVVKEGSVIIVDEFTGRLMEGRQWSDGLHQAVEAKEGVKIKEETQTLATVTLQNFFKLYGKICGMTGTGMTEANEFWKIYELDVIAIPTNRPLHRLEYPDVIYRTEKEKYVAVADEIEDLNRWDKLELNNRDEVWGNITKEDDQSVTIQIKESKRKDKIPKSKISEIHRKGRPVLVGTVSIEKSERLSSLLDQRGVKHKVLNAKFHKQEAEIVAQAGRLGAVTIATNMAGRGTDIVLGGNPETMAWARLQDKYETRLDVPREEWDALIEEISTSENMEEEGDQVRELGGLAVIGTERHDARRIDLQLRGRTGRQGDPGTSRFYLSLEDDLMKIFAGDWVKSILERLGMKEGERIESRLVTRRIEAAQKKREEHNFEIRKNLLEYDEVMDEQRKRIYNYRQQILDGVNCRDLLLDMIGEQADYHLDELLARDFGVETFASWAGTQLSTTLEPKQFRGTDIQTAEQVAKDEAERAAESDIISAIDENLPDGDEEAEGDWNWEALAKFANTRWGLNLRDRDLKKVGRNGVAELLIERAHKAIHDVDLEEGAQFLDEEYGFRSALEWVRNKFGIELTEDEVRTELSLNAISDIEPDDMKRLVVVRAEEMYDAKEAEYPVLAGLYRYTKASAGGSRIDREGLVAWARERFETDFSLDDLRHKQREEIRESLVELSRQHQQKSKQVKEEGLERLNETVNSPAFRDGSSNGELSSLADWMNETLDAEVTEDELEKLDADQLEQKLVSAIGDHFHPEMRRMERMVLLEIVDTAWKDHLLAMDYLLAAVRLKGWAQLDPKVEYKREGMKLYDQVWTSIGERVTDLIFRMEQLDEDFVGETWVETEARHDEVQSDIARQQDAAIANTQGDGKIEPIRKRGQQVGRNDPCPCGSGKKYKRCCMRRDQGLGAA